MTPHTDLVAVVTGASRGLGAGLAATFAADGIRLGLCARTRPAVPPKAADAVTEKVDVTDAATLGTFAYRIAERFGRIDLWVNNAGVLEPVGPLVAADPVALRRNVEVNVLGVLHGSAIFARHVRSRSGRGVLVNMVSGAASHPYEGWSAYCASKAAVSMVTEVVAKRGAGPRVASVRPGTGCGGHRYAGAHPGHEPRGLRGGRPLPAPPRRGANPASVTGGPIRPRPAGRWARRERADLPVQVRVPDDFPQD